ncbi:enoyl-CoA hydratase/isomerase family protein [Acrocarpospora catenulata]|uniref:enoyl-CoA hydratase/isomerase family protein n=1 Tax=Acrocarpospora catenulata TaxID=2836182 RepID=UPI001BDAE779|nr:enoyl-CoA hydratase-related protein [Acrocarpospora catenulata]
METVRYERRGHVAWVTLNRPERKNTLVAESFRLLASAWDEVRTDPRIRVAVLTAAGTEDFCCGGDIGEYIAPRTGADGGSAQAPPDYRAALLLDEPLYKPIIAAINGRALGGGTELLEATDVRIAAEHATFGLPEAKLGIVPGAGSMVRLTRQVPYAHAMRILLTGDHIDARTALDWGLISEIVPGGDLLARAAELAERIAANAPIAVQTIKRIALETHTQDWATAFEAEAAATAAVGETEDAKEGPAAFLARRRPEFKGR